MITEKDVHNYMVDNFSDKEKMDIVIWTGGDTDSIQQLEKTVADGLNAITTVVREVLSKPGMNYLNTKH